ncbi:MAG: PLP-dependent aminotransferase family protein [Anaerolineae bacterium]|nr:PLP-dependent aminotransferase family protein [Anaerolineae bacterium]
MVHVDLPINKTAEEPLYRQIIRLVRERIVEGSWVPGERLPGSRELADTLGISRISVVNAYAELREEGLIVGQAGRGTFVTGPNGLTNDPRALPSVAANPIAHVTQRHPPNVIAFSGGAPAEEFLPVSLIRQAYNAVLDRDGADALLYEETEGYLPLRQAIAEYSRTTGINCRAEHVLITGGCQQALDMAVQALLSEGDALITTNPTYLGILDLARVRRVQVFGIPMDEDGIKIDALQEALIHHRARAIYIAPTYHNPTGTVMSIHRRRRLLQVAADFGVPVLEDGVYHELGFAGTPPPPLKALDSEGIVLHTNGFSKIVLPGTRIGYVIGEGPVWERIMRVKRAADICTPTLNQRAMHYFLQTGALSGHLDRVRKIIRERRDSMIRSLQRHMPEGTRWSTPTGGMYLWVELPHNGPTVAELYNNAIKQGVTFAMGPMFHTDGGGGYFMRLNFAAQAPDKIEEGVRRLRAAWHGLSAQNSGVVLRDTEHIL